MLIVPAQYQGMFDAEYTVIWKRTLDQSDLSVGKTAQNHTRGIKMNISLSRSWQVRTKTGRATQGKCDWPSMVKCG